MKELFLEKKGIYYRMNEFERNRPTLLFIHGLSSSSSAWIDYEKKFENKYNIVLPDLRGHGNSHKLKSYDDYKISKLADDIYDLVTHLNLEKFFLISHSFGTLIALEFLVSHQDRVRGAIFLSPSSNAGKRVAVKIIKPFLGLGHLFPARNNKGHVEYSKYKGTGDWNIWRLSADILNTSTRVYLFCTKQSYGFNRENFLEKIHIPTLLIHGKDDTIFPVENSVLMDKKMKNSELILLDNTDHIIVLNNASEICAAIENFVENNYNKL